MKDNLFFSALKKDLNDLKKKSLKTSVLNDTSAQLCIYKVYTHDPLELSVDKGIPNRLLNGGTETSVTEALHVIS